MGKTCHIKCAEKSKSGKWQKGGPSGSSPGIPEQKIEYPFIEMARGHLTATPGHFLIPV